MAEVQQSGGNRHQKGKKHKARVGVRMDMTPMVDVAFLLLTFFMLATTLLTPQVMEVSLPPDSKVPVQIAESNLLTLRVRKDQTVFWNVGQGEVAGGDHLVGGQPGVQPGGQWIGHAWGITVAKGRGDKQAKAG